MPERSQDHVDMEDLVLEALKSGPKHTWYLRGLLKHHFPARSDRMNYEVLKRMAWKGMIENVKLPYSSHYPGRGWGYKVMETAEQNRRA
jgi:hypothetical protein